jgi:phospholipase A1
MAREDQWRSEGLFIVPHRPNYFMPVSYNPNPNEKPFPPGTPLLDIETKFQFSMKMCLFEKLGTYDIRTYLAYTQVSFWQAYNRQKSSLFRETDYEPELFLQFPSLGKIGSWTNRYNRFGYDHQSNGEADPISRSWNRLVAEFVIDHKNSMISIRPWYRLNGPPENDSNPNMWKYYGYGELRGAIKMWKTQEFSLLFRNNFRIPENKGAVELGWSFPLLKTMKGFLQYFNGYGESLIDHDVPVSRVSVGVSFSDWL